MAKDFVVNNGSLILCDAFNYATVYNELVALYDNTHFDFIAIDHSCALVGSAGNGSMHDNVVALSTAVKNFRKIYPVCVMVTSHPSTTAKNSDSNGRETTDSATKGAQDLSTDADEVLYLRDNETLRKQGLVMIENLKRRDAARATDYIILRTHLAVSAFIYDEEEQASDNALGIKREAGIAMLEEMYNGGDTDNYNI